jgi:hypothetical protein
MMAGARMILSALQNGTNMTQKHECVRMLEMILKYDTIWN